GTAGPADAAARRPALSRDRCLRDGALRVPGPGATGRCGMRTSCLRPGCHHVLTRRQVAFGKGYCSRSCAARACWHDRPDVRRRRLQGMRRERTQRRVDLWAQPAWERLARLVDVDALDRQVIGAIRLVLADAVL